MSLAIGHCCWRCCAHLLYVCLMDNGQATNYHWKWTNGSLLRTATSVAFRWQYANLWFELLKKEGWTEWHFVDNRRIFYGFRSVYMPFYQVWVWVRHCEHVCVCVWKPMCLLSLANSMKIEWLLCLAMWSLRRETKLALPRTISHNDRMSVSLRLLMVGRGFHLWATYTMPEEKSQRY